MNKSQNKIKKINNEETELVKLNDLFFKKNNVKIEWKLSSFWPCLVFVIVPLICEFIFAFLIKFTNNKIIFLYIYLVLMSIQFLYALVGFVICICELLKFKRHYSKSLVQDFYKNKEFTTSVRKQIKNINRNILNEYIEFLNQKITFFEIYSNIMGPTSIISFFLMIPETIQEITKLVNCEQANEILIILVLLPLISTIFFVFWTIDNIKYKRIYMYLNAIVSSEK